MNSTLHYNVYFSFKEHVEAVTGLEAMRMFLNDLVELGFLMHYSILKNRDQSEGAMLPPYQVNAVMSPEGFKHSIHSVEKNGGPWKGLHGEMARFIQIFKVQIFDELENDPRLERGQIA